MNKERVEPDEDLANVAYELSSNGRNTNLTTRLPGIKKFNKYGMFWTSKIQDKSHFLNWNDKAYDCFIQEKLRKTRDTGQATYIICQQVHIQPGHMGYPITQGASFPLPEGLAFERIEE